MNDRRSFMIATGLAAGSAVAHGFSVPTSGTPEGEVRHLVSQYGSDIQISEKANGGWDVQLRLQDHQKLCEVFSSKDFPFGVVKATERNTLEFSHRGRHFEVSHLS